MNRNNAVVLGMDHGNGWMKVRSKFKKIILPSAIVPANQVEKDTFSSKETKLKTYKSTAHNNAEYCWGEDVIKFPLLNTYGLQDRYKSNLYKQLNVFAIAEMLLDFNEDQRKNVIIITGVPSTEKDTQLEKDLIKGLEGSHVVTVNDEEIVFKVTKVVVMAQPAGTLMSIYLDDEGFVKDEDIADEKVGIIDVGTGTTDLDIFEMLRRKDNGKDSIPNGMHDVYRSVEKVIKKDHPSAAVNAQLVEKQFNSDSYVISKRSVVDITAAKEEAINTIGDKLKSDIGGVWKTWQQLDRIYITGGGSSVLGSKIKELISDAIIVENAQTANVDGYYNYGVAQFLGDEK